MEKIFYNIIVKLCIIIYPNIKVKDYINPYFKLFIKINREQGLLKTVKYFKACRLHCTRYMCNSPLFHNDLKIGIDSSGWPKRLLFLKPLLNGKLDESKFLMTILCIPRIIIPKGKDKKALKPDYDSIIKTSKVSKIIPTGFIKEFVKRYNLHAEHPEFNLKNIYLSNKSGPHGKATLTAMEGLTQYSYPLMQAIFNITDKNGSDYFCQSYSFAWDKNLGSGKKGLGKLSFIYDPECKLRIVAIVDYYTQLFLKPIHEAIFKKLNNLPQDRTFTQDPLNAWKDDGNKFWSLDLSSATDRFPISLQRRLLEQMFSDTLAKSWEYILSSREFKTPEGDYIKYSVGQPMGSYSSWAAFTLTHHLLVQWCAKLCGLNNFTDYILLGDDIVIKNDNVAKKYIEWTNYLGVDISFNKTHASLDTYEFAKRWISKGREITGLPFNGIVNNINNPFIVAVNLFDYFKIKGNYISSTKNLSVILYSLYKGLNKNLSIKYSNSRFRMKVRVFLESLNFAFGYSTPSSLREMLCENISNELYMIPNDNLIHQIFDDVIKLGLGKSIGNSMNVIAEVSEGLVNRKEELNLSDINEIRFLPVFQGVVNHINKYKEAVQKWDFEVSDFRSKSKDLLMLNIDSVFNKERNKTLELVNTGKIFKLGFNEINNLDEIYYGSATVESNYDLTSDVMKLIQSGYAMNLSTFDKLACGTYVPPKSLDELSNDTISAWENFSL